MNRVLMCAAVGAIIFVMPATAQEGVKRTPLGTIEYPPGYQTVIGYAELIMPNICGGRHTHPGGETTYVLEGELTVKVDGQPDKLVKAGGAYQLPAGVVHDGCSSISGTKVLTVHVVEKGKPLASTVP